MNRVYNFKKYNLNEAKKCFLNDLKNDKDFIEYKKNSIGYGTLISTVNTFCLNNVGLASQSLITKFFQSNLIYDSSIP